LTSLYDYFVACFEFKSNLIFLAICEKSPVTSINTQAIFVIVIVNTISEISSCDSNHKRSISCINHLNLKCLSILNCLSAKDGGVREFPRFDSKDAVLDLNLAVRGVNSKI
jgi:hypothetical protein